MVFLSNTCFWQECGCSFPCTEDLIQHIEETHILFSDHTFLLKQEEQQPPTIHLSYVNRFYTEEALAKRRYSSCSEDSDDSMPSRKRSKSEKSDCSSWSSSDKSDACSETSEDTLDILETLDDGCQVSAEAILSSIVMDEGSDKPYVCSVPGCGKRYKNPNGIKYHAIHGHTEESLIKKPYKCPMNGCGKRYKNTNGLKHHMGVSHPAAVLLEELQVE
eukprot:Colp12_sorted_trinity150504_noHs@31090